MQEEVKRMQHQWVVKRSGECCLKCSEEKSCHPDWKLKVEMKEHREIYTHKK